jgi:hypothetical protein
VLYDQPFGEILDTSLLGYSLPSPRYQFAMVEPVTKTVGL